MSDFDWEMKEDAAEGFTVLYSGACR